MLSCLNPAACLGALEDGFEAEGSCHASYQGRLCSECEDGFVRNWKFECSRCPSLAQNLGVSVALGLFGVTVLTLLVRHPRARCQTVGREELRRGLSDGSLRLEQSLHRRRPLHFKGEQQG